MLLVDKDFLSQARALINMAAIRIDIATFKAEYNSKPRGRALRLLFEDLFKKNDCGLSVNFLINGNAERRAVPLTNRFVIQELKRRKIDVRTLPNNRCCHAKILIVDKRIAIIGSHNLGVKSCHNNFEVSYLIQNPANIARLCSVFDHTFSTANKL